MVQNKFTRVRRALIAIFVSALAATGTEAQTRTEPFYLGVDISFVGSQAEASRQNLLDLLKEHGINAVRLRTFVDPTETGGYNSNGACGLAETVSFGKQIKASGMSFLVDFHYSNNWADPGKQCVPVQWQHFTNIQQMSEAVHDYTEDAITQLIAANARPDMVQIGNETNSGMLRHRCDERGEPTGNNPVSGDKSNWSNLGALLKAGVDAVNGVDSAIMTSFHIAKGGDHDDGRSALSFSIDWLRNALRYTSVDAFGESCYATYQGDKNNREKTKMIWQTVQDGLVNEFPDIKIFAAEIGGFLREINDVNFNLPDQRGIGTFFWEATFSNDSWNTGALVSRSGDGYVPTDRLSLYDEMFEDYGLEAITTGIDPRKTTLKVDSHGRLQMFRAGEGALFGISDPNREGMLRDPMGRFLKTQRLEIKKN